MRLQELLEATYGVDTRYTEEDANRIGNALIASIQWAATKGVTIELADHFFDQQFMKRSRNENGMSKITHNEVLDTFSRLLTRGLTFFKGKEPGTNYVFFDNKTLLNVPMIKKENNKYLIPSSIIKDLKYYGNYQKITL